MPPDTGLKYRLPLMSEFVSNEIVASSVHYVIKATRKLTIHEMNAAINQRRTRPESFPAQPGDTLKMFYSTLPDDTRPELRLPEGERSAGSPPLPRDQAEHTPTTVRDITF